MRKLIFFLSSAVALLSSGNALVGQLTSESLDERNHAWRVLPLLRGERIHENWVQIGLGRFRVVDGTIRTDPQPEGWGLLVFQKEKFGNCQIKVVYRCRHPAANSGVFVRLDDGILRSGKQPPVKRNANGGLDEVELAKLQSQAKAELGAWYAVSHGFEVQIQDRGPDEYHQTGSVYSFSKAADVPKAEKADVWRTMIITLKGKMIQTQIDAPTQKNGYVTLSKFVIADKDPRKSSEWYEPKWGPRPERGYIGLQTHDPGDVVYFREVSVRQLPKK